MKQSAWSYRPAEVERLRARIAEMQSRKGAGLSDDAQAEIERLNSELSGTRRIARVFKAMFVLTPS